ncbi:hypothetical protein [Methanoregula sp.]|uniref:hypothetical protein n=1 Tax=Methanoregula sp. TaxID=2052170 RepID=UPI0023741DBE|nr:hypothetical protein [Methanoregula sp.]MDD1687554.1 hypothetical protein [Methanoregula sp.]
MRARKIPLLLTGIIHTALQSCEGVRFQADDTCPCCGGAMSGYDERKKRFAVLIEEGQTIPVHVIIRRSYCRTCKIFSRPPEPFYCGTRVGSPVVDLCRSFSRTMPYSRAATYLQRMGVMVDRWSVRQYAMISLPDKPTMEVFGMQIPLSIITLSTLAGSARETVTLGMDDVLDACSYPSAVQDSTTYPGPADTFRTG